MRPTTLASAFFKTFAKHFDFEQLKRTKVFIWFTGVIVLVGLTIRDIYPLVNEYKNNNVAAIVKIVTGNETIEPPPLTLCIPREPRSLHRIAEYVTNFSKNSTILCDECSKTKKFWNDLVFSESNTIDANYKILSEGISKKLLLDYNGSSFETLSVNNANWNQPLVEAAWDLFNCYADIDSIVKAGTNNQTWAEECAGNDNLNSALASNKQKLETIYKSIVDILCQYLKFDNPLHICQQVFDSYSSVIYANAFCFAIPMWQEGASVSFNSSCQSNNIQWPGLIETEIPFIVSADTSMLTWPLTSWKVSDPLYTSETLNSQLLTATEQVLLKYFVSVTVSETRKDQLCFKDNTPAECRANCMTGKIVQLCQCIPFTFRKSITVSDDLPFCNPNLYATCQLNKVSTEEDCMTKCKNPCRYVFYQWHVSRRIIPNSQRRFELLASPVFYPFVEFTVATKDLPEQLFSQVAAVFNLYLGLSGLSVIAVVVACGDAFFRWYQSRKRCLTKVNATLECTCVRVQDLQSEAPQSSCTASQSIIQEIDFRKEVREAIVQLKRRLDQDDQWKKKQAVSTDKLKIDIASMQRKLDQLADSLHYRLYKK